MATIHILKQIDSETLHLPELRPLLGRTVEITIVDKEQKPAATLEDWEKFFRDNGTDFVDPNVVGEHRAYDQSQNQPPKP
jgi:hypothetical protein